MSSSFLHRLALTIISVSVLSVIFTTNSPLVSAAPAYSGLLTFATGAEEIYVIRPDGSSKVEIANGTSPVFSQDGSRFSYKRTTPIQSLQQYAR